MIRGTRRQFLNYALGASALGLLSGCGSLSALAPSRKAVRVGFLGPRNATLDALRQGLRDHGYVEGENLILEVRLTGSTPEEINTATVEILSLKLDAIVVGGNGYAVAVKDQSSTMPIVLAMSSDPVQTGLAERLAESFARPGGSVTGVTAISHQLSGKRLALLKEVVPSMSRVGVLWNESNPTKADEWRETELGAQSLSLPISSLGLRGVNDLDAAFELARRDHVDGLVVLADSLVSSQQSRIAELALAHQLPTMYELRVNGPAVGGLMSYGPNSAGMYRRAADFVDRILKGGNPAEMPIEQPTVYDFVINLKTAQALGITISPPVLSQATEVIQ